MTLERNHPQLYPWLKDKIQKSPGGRTSFAQYMEWVLYHPEFGYYSAYQTKIGKSGDYFTSSSLGADFAQLLARQWGQMWQTLVVRLCFLWWKWGRERDKWRLMCWGN